MLIMSWRGRHLDKVTIKTFCSLQCKTNIYNIKITATNALQEADRLNKWCIKSRLRISALSKCVIKSGLTHFSTVIDLSVVRS